MPVGQGSATQDLIGALTLAAVRAKEQTQNLIRNWFCQTAPETNVFKTQEIRSLEIIGRDRNTPRLPNETVDQFRLRLCGRILDMIAGGVHDGGSGSASLIDSTAGFVQAGVRASDILKNITDLSVAKAVVISPTEVTGTLQGGTEDDWDDGDVYEIQAREKRVEGGAFQLNQGIGNANDIITITSAFTLLIFNQFSQAQPPVGFFNLLFSSVSNQVYDGASDYDGALNYDAVPPNQLFLTFNVADMGSFDATELVNQLRPRVRASIATADIKVIFI